MSDSVSSEKLKVLQEQLERLEIKESDLEESFIRGSGPGGQKINKTASCVRLRHLPTGIEIRCQKTRSQSMNRFYARRELCERLAALVRQEKTKKQQAAEKIKRQKRRRSRRQKEKMLNDKRKQGERKVQRGKIRGAD